MAPKVHIDVKIISRESIKPSSPTPPHLKTFNLSSFDQAYPTNHYTSFLIFYPFLDYHLQDRCVHELKSSLSKTLTLFYPLAGRMRENVPFIDCTDEGAYFIEAKISGSLSDVLKHPDPDVLSRLLPIEVVPVEDAGASGVLLLVQANLFDCGGLAVGFSIAHKVADATTINLFIKGWVAQARGDVDVVAPDITAIASRFPVVSVIYQPDSSQISSLKTKSFKTKRFFFDSKSVNALKIKATNAGLQRPSRVEVIAGHIWLSTMKLNVRNSTKKTYYALGQAIDLRQRIEPPLSKNTFGNLVDISFALAREVSDDKVPDLEGLIGKMRIAFQCSMESYAKKNNSEQETFLETHEHKEQMRLLPKEDVEMVALLVTSMCRLWFHKNSDFGWGEPVWFTICCFQIQMNCVILSDGEDGDGVQAWVTLEERVLDLLQTDQDFLEFASVNPSINLHFNDHIHNLFQF